MDGPGWEGKVVPPADHSDHLSLERAGDKKDKQPEAPLGTNLRMRSGSVVWSEALGLWGARGGGQQASKHHHDQRQG